MSPRPPRRPKTRPPDRDAPGGSRRLFLAVPLPPPVRELVADLVADLAADGWPVRWVAAESAHLTLHFLGETVPERAELLRLALPSVVARHAPFALRTAGLGVFPNLRRPRVLWLGLHGPAHRLETLRADLAAALDGLGFPVETGPFRPHLTLGRVRNSGTADFPLRDLPEAVRRRVDLLGEGGASVPAARPLPVGAVELVHSRLGPGGARHDAIGCYPLVGPPPGLPAGELP